MASLAAKRCVPCNKDTEALEPEQIKPLLKEIASGGWQALDDGSLLILEVAFKNFAEASAFVQKVSAIAEEENHHPDIAFGWGYCSLALQTHAIGGLHENDFVLAAKINTVLPKAA